MPCERGAGAQHSLLSAIACDDAFPIARSLADDVRPELPDSKQAPRPEAECVVLVAAGPLDAQDQRGA